MFPRYAKSFKHKLQASGWDIPLFSPSGPDRLPSPDTSLSRPLSTGFSGTNDWKRLLPLTISQQDLSNLSHTNAEVLTYLLQPRNRACVVAADVNGSYLSEEQLLRQITKSDLRVLIDAGAYILEKTDLDLVKYVAACQTAEPSRIISGLC